MFNYLPTLVVCKMNVVMFVANILWMLLLETALAAPKDEFRSFVSEGELSLHDENLLMGIIPSGYPSQKSHKQEEAIIHRIKVNEHIKTFKRYVEQGVTSKDLTFNVYDDNMREASITLYRLFQSIEASGHDPDRLFDFENINEDMVTYARHLEMLYKNRRDGKKIFSPPFIRKPSFFVNIETIVKALKLINNMDLNETSVHEKTNSYFGMNEAIVINANYSGWNLPENGGEELTNYFREDISLNSYYYGIHLMHPYWMSNDELDAMNERHAEHYYYKHQQLLARYYLESEHLKQTNTSNHCERYSPFNPYLIHANGLPFPVRSNALGEWNEDRAKLKSIDIAIKECISRGLVVMDNGTTINMTEDSHIGLLAKLIRANLDGIKTAKILRTVFGYGGNGYPSNEYNAAPSVMHFPETALRDPIYWRMIEYVQKYFTGYKNAMEPFDISEYETDDYAIIDVNVPKITTYFDFYQFNINKAVTKSDNPAKWPFTVNARQKRLAHSQFTIDFTVNSRSIKNVIVRLFLGPPCYSNVCWNKYYRFFEIDSFPYYLDEGTNVISWSPNTSSRLSFDDYYNMERPTSESKDNKFNLFRFPENLVVPRGSEKGINLTLFIIITTADDTYSTDHQESNNLYKQLSYEIDNKPLGFPFHRPSIGHNDECNNYRFTSFFVYHKRYSNAKNGYFSSELY